MNRERYPVDLLVQKWGPWGHWEVRIELELILKFCVFELNQPRLQKQLTRKKDSRAGTSERAEDTAWGTGTACAPASSCPQSGSLGTACGKQQQLAQVSRLLPLIWESQKKLLIPGFGLTHPQQLWPSGEGSRSWKISHCLFLSLCNSDFLSKINKSLKTFLIK